MATSLKECFKEVEHRLEKLELRVTTLEAKNGMAISLIKYVIFPMILVLGGLIGIRLM